MAPLDEPADEAQTIGKKAPVQELEAPVEQTEVPVKEPECAESWKLDVDARAKMALPKPADVRVLRADGGVTTVEEVRKAAGSVKNCRSILRQQADLVVVRETDYEVPK